MEIEKILEYQFDESKIEEKMHKLRENNLFLSDKQIEILKRYNINYQNYLSTSELIYAIDEVLNLEESEELENILNELEEYHYYQEVNK
jgi:hypothetical protein